MFINIGVCIFFFILFTLAMICCNGCCCCCCWTARALLWVYAHDNGNGKARLSCSFYCLREKMRSEIWNNIIFCLSMSCTCEWVSSTFSTKCYYQSRIPIINKVQNMWQKNLNSHLLKVRDWHIIEFLMLNRSSEYQ